MNALTDDELFESQISPLDSVCFEVKFYFRVNNDYERCYYTITLSAIAEDDCEKVFVNVLLVMDYFRVKIQCLIAFVFALKDYFRISSDHEVIVTT